MKAASWKLLATLSGVIGAVVTRKVMAAVWPGDDDPPRNPADHTISWPDALRWAVASGVGAGIARLVGQRAAAAGWERATGESPPGIETTPA